MEEYFCSGKGQGGPEAGNVLEVEEGSFCDLVDVVTIKRVGSRMIPRLWTWWRG